MSTTKTPSCCSKCGELLKLREVSYQQGFDVITGLPLEPKKESWLECPDNHDLWFFGYGTTGSQWIKFNKPR